MFIYCRSGRVVSSWGCSAVVARLVRIEKVPGSIPGSSTIFFGFHFFALFCCGGWLVGLSIEGEGRSREEQLRKRRRAKSLWIRFSSSFPFFLLFSCGFLPRSHAAFTRIFSMSLVVYGLFFLLKHAVHSFGMISLFIYHLLSSSLLLPRRASPTATALRPSPTLRQRQPARCQQRERRPRAVAAPAVRPSGQPPCRACCSENRSAPALAGLRRGGGSSSGVRKTEEKGTRER